MDWLITLNDAGLLTWNIVFIAMALAAISVLLGVLWIVVSSNRVGMQAVTSQMKRLEDLEKANIVLEARLDEQESDIKRQQSLIFKLRKMLVSERKSNEQLKQKLEDEREQHALKTKAMQAEIDKLRKIVRHLLRKFDDEQIPSKGAKWALEEETK